VPVSPFPVRGEILASSRGMYPPPAEHPRMGPDGPAPSTRRPSLPPSTRSIHRTSASSAPIPGTTKPSAVPSRTLGRKSYAGLALMVPLKRAGRPEEIAQTIVFMSSDKASYITVSDPTIIEKTAGNTFVYAGRTGNANVKTRVLYGGQDRSGIVPREQRR
jgi:Enoyl-(Acyl carrier protein) reductase